MDRAARQTQKNLRQDHGSAGELLISDGAAAKAAAAAARAWGTSFHAATHGASSSHVSDSFGDETMD
jgi:hypothetical protein